MRYNQLTTEQYIEMARTIHSDTFDYSNTVYISMGKKITIRCKKHGIFECYAGNHVNRKVMSVLTRICTKNLNHSARLTELARLEQQSRLSDSTWIK